jgi:hypothetical protein
MKIFDRVGKDTHCLVPLLVSDLLKDLTQMFFFNSKFVSNFFISLKLFIPSPNVLNLYLLKSNKLERFSMLVTSALFDMKAVAYLSQVLHWSYPQILEL